MQLWWCRNPTKMLDSISRVVHVFGLSFYFATVFGETSNHLTFCRLGGLSFRDTWCYGTWGVDHTNHFSHRPSTSSTVIVWKVVGWHLFLDIILINFTAETRHKVWCDRGMSIGNFIFPWRSSCVLCFAYYLFTYLCERQYRHPRILFDTLWSKSVNNTKQRKPCS
jgi:hypothetical protein